MSTMENLTRNMNPETMKETEIDIDKKTDILMKMIAPETTLVQVEGKAKGTGQIDTETQDQTAGTTTAEISTGTLLGIAIEVDIEMKEDQKED